MARLTTLNNRFEVPDDETPADLALQLQRIAQQFEPKMLDLQWWADFMGSGTSFDEVSTPAIYRSNSTSQTGFLRSTQKAISWDTTLFDNTGTSQPAGDLILPDQDQRYWWWMGANIFLPPITLDARFTGRILVQDRDPATGQVLTQETRYNQYMRTEGDQYMCWDGFYRSGGGRQRVTMSHGSVGAASVLAGCSVWAVRICPDR